jgi:hypothetical protein
MLSEPNQKYVAVVTPLGELHGRDAIFLNEVIVGRNVLKLRGEFNGGLISRPQEDDIGYTLAFNGLVAFSMTTLDACSEFGVSSFDEILNSKWLQIRRNVRPDALDYNGLRHFFVQTYDDVFSIVSRGYELLLN